MKRKARVTILVLLAGTLVGILFFQVFERPEAGPEPEEALADWEEPRTLEAWRSKVREDIRLEKKKGEGSDQLRSLEAFSRFLETPQAEALFMVPKGSPDGGRVPWPAGDYHTEWPPKDPSFMEPRGDGLPPVPKQELRSTPPLHEPVFPD